MQSFFLFLRLLASAIGMKVTMSYCRCHSESVSSLPQNLSHFFFFFFKKHKAGICVHDWKVKLGFRLKRKQILFDIRTLVHCVLSMRTIKCDASLPNAEWYKVYGIQRREMHEESARRNSNECDDFVYELHLIMMWVQMSHCCQVGWMPSRGDASS